MAHITGGGIPGNLPRVFSRSVRAKIDLGSWPVPPIFSYLASLGKLDREELLSTFNMGVGMGYLIVPAKHLRALETDLKRRREKFYRIGEIVTGNGARITYSGQKCSTLSDLPVLILVTPSFLSCRSLSAPSLRLCCCRKTWAHPQVSHLHLGSLTFFYDFN